MERKTHTAAIIFKLTNMKPKSPELIAYANKIFLKGCIDDNDILIDIALKSGANKNYKDPDTGIYALQYLIEHQEKKLTQLKKK